MKLDGLKVATLLTDGYEPSELTEPMRALREAGAEVTIVSNHDGTITGKQEQHTAQVDMTLDTARADEFGGLLIPGGVKNPDVMRQDERAARFVRAFFEAGKPIASICHGLQLLSAAGVLKGKSCTAYPACGPDIGAAGGKYVEVPVDSVHVDGNLVTAPAWPAHPAWLAAFLKVLGAKIET